MQPGHRSSGDDVPLPDTVRLPAPVARATPLCRAARPVRVSAGSTPPDRMTDQMPTRLIAISLRCCCCCWSRDCAAQTADPGAVRVGDRWSYDIKDDLTGDLRHAITVVVVDDQRQGDHDASYHSAGKDRPQTMVLRSRLGPNRRRRLEASSKRDRNQEAAAGRQGVAIGCQRDASAIRRRLSRVRNLRKLWQKSRSRRRPEHSIRFGST